MGVWTRYLKLRRKCRGIGSLGSVLMVSGLAMLATLLLASVSVTHLNLSHRVGHEVVARHAAESAVAEAIRRILQDEKYGTAGTEVVKASLPNAEGTVAFDPKALGSLAWSLNNLSNSRTAAGPGTQIVPPEAVYLIGEGRCNKVVARVEAIIHVPRFPWAIAASGKVESKGDLLVASAADPQGVLDGTVPIEELLPGHLVSNSTDPKALKLGANTRITGDVQASGGVDLDPKTVVLGEQRTFSSPASIPDIDVRSFDPKGQGEVQDLPGSMGTTTLTGFARRSGQLDIQGDLILDGGVLYVDGSLNISGAIKGKGAIFVTGTTQVRGGAALDSDNQAVLVTGGDVSLSGSGNQHAFQGLVYTKGNFQADNVTLMGSFITAGEGRNMTLNNVALFQKTDYTELEFALPPPVVKPPRSAMALSSAPPTPPDAAGAVLLKHNSGACTKMVEVGVHYDGKSFTYDVLTPNGWKTGLTKGEAEATAPLFAEWGSDSSWDQSAFQRLEQAAVDTFNSKPPESTEVVTAASLDSAPAVVAPTQKKDGPLFKFDLSKFINRADQMQIVLWRDL